MPLALFDLDNTLLAGDSDYLWGCFLVEKGLVDKKLYEVDLSLRALRVELRFDPFTLSRVEVWHQGALMCLARPVNLQLNSETGGSQSYEER